MASVRMGTLQGNNIQRSHWYRTGRENIDLDENKKIGNEQEGKQNQIWQETDAINTERECTG